MSTTLKEWLLKTIAELEEERDAVPGIVNEDAAMALAAMKLAMASLEAEAVAFRSKLKPPSAIGSEHWDYTDHRQPDAFELESCVIERLFTEPPALVAVPAGYRLQPISEYDAMCSAMLQGADGNAPAHFRSRPAQSNLSPAQGGNSPAIPDGWVLVPVEPTCQMCEAMGLPWESPRFPDRYKAMIAAAKNES